VDEAGRKSDVVVIRSRSDVYRFVNDASFKTRSLKLLLFAALVSFLVDGYDLTGISIGIRSLQQQFHMSPAQVGLVGSSAVFGALVAAIAGGYFVDRIGRLRMFFLDLICFVVAAIVAAFAPNPGVLIAARVLMGIGIGLDIPAAYALITEFSAVANKRRVANNFLLYTDYAVAGIYVLGILLFNAGAGLNLWRWIVGLSAIPAMAILVLRWFCMTESPFWAASRGDLAGAARILTRVLGVTVEVAPSPPETMAARVLRYRDIFARQYLPRTVASSAINVFQSMEYYALGFYLPVVTARLFPKSFTVALLAALGIQLFAFVGASFSAVTAQRLGLRFQALYGFGFQIIILGVLGVFGPSMPLLTAWVLLGVFLAVHQFGPGQTGVSMAALSYPTELRGQGTGFSFGIGRAGGVVGSYLFPVVLAALGLYHTVLVIAIVPLLGWLVMWSIRWDPTGTEADFEPVGAQELQPQVGTASAR
jgi:putative MFS transporter